jgi:hypothetical protein
VRALQTLENRLRQGSGTRQFVSRQPPRRGSLPTPHWWPMVGGCHQLHPNMLVIAGTVGAFSDLKVSGTCGSAAASQDFRCMSLSKLLFRNEASAHLLREGSETTVDWAHALAWSPLWEAIDENEFFAHLAGVWTENPGLPPPRRDPESPNTVGGNGTNNKMEDTYEINYSPVSNSSSGRLGAGGLQSKQSRKFNRDAIPQLKYEP